MPVGKISLFNEYEAMNEVGNVIAEDFHQFAKQFFTRYLEDGYSIRDAELIAHSSIACAAAEIILRNALKMKKEKDANVKVR